MLRQLARLTRPVPRAGRRAIAIAVYADEQDRPIPARETGEEGVACVDDAARALALYCALWRRTRAPQLLREAEGLLDFLLYMEVAPGRFANFIHDWDGQRNLEGPTSSGDGLFWNARALRGLATATATGIPSAADAYGRALAATSDEPTGGDIRAIQARALLELPEGLAGSELRGRLVRWCDEIAALREGEVLLDNRHERPVHLWAHAQEGVLAQAGRLLRREDLVQVARRSAKVVFVPTIVAAFDRPVVQPDAVASAVFAMDALGEATGDARYKELAALARAWFAGRNSANAPVYDPVAGRVADGIDNGVVSRRSGAEANIVAAESLLTSSAGASHRDVGGAYSVSNSGE